MEIVPGVHWFSTGLPFRLSAINLWLLRDADGWTMVDCGIALPEARRQIEAVWGRVLGDAPVTRLIITHHHIDHVANCRWICDRWGIVPTMTHSEHSRAEILMGTGWAQEWDQRLAFWQKHGLSEATATEVNNAWDADRDLYAPLPSRWNRIQDGDTLRIGGYSWHVIVGRGHAPEQALLYSPEQKVLISGDQVLTTITPNVSVFDDEPDAEPLSLFLRSNKRIGETCRDVLVLPSHNLPFRGLQARIRELEHHHDERLARIEREIRIRPHTAAALLPSLFGALSGHELGFAMGEIVAHLHHLVAQGRARGTERNGTVIFAGL